MLYVHDCGETIVIGLRSRDASVTFCPLLRGHTSAGWVALLRVLDGVDLLECAGRHATIVQ